MVFAFFTECCVVRHGETGWNSERRLQGHRDIPLNVTGERRVVGEGRVLDTPFTIAEV